MCVCVCVCETVDEKATHKRNVAFQWRPQAGLMGDWFSLRLSFTERGHLTHKNPSVFYLLTSKQQGEMSDARHAKQPQAQTDNKIIQEKKNHWKNKKKQKSVLTPASVGSVKTTRKKKTMSNKTKGSKLKDK